MIENLDWDIGVEHEPHALRPDVGMLAREQILEARDGYLLITASYLI